MLFGGGFEDELRLNARDNVGGGCGAHLVGTQDRAEVVFECGWDLSHVCELR